VHRYTKEKMSGFGDGAGLLGNYKGGAPPTMSLEPNSTKDSIMTGAVRPTIVTTEIQYSNNILIDSKSRIGVRDTPFNFTVDIGSNIFRQRQATVQKVTIPLINNVTPLNNFIRFGVRETSGVAWAADAINTVLQPAVYDPTGLCNEIASRMNAALDVYELNNPGLQPTGRFVISFDVPTQSFLVRVTSQTMTFVFYAECSFIERGRLLHALPGVDNDFSVLDYYDEIRGGSAAMLYTRTLTIHSDRLTNTAFARSRTSDLKIPTNIIAVVDVSSIYEPESFNVGVPFAGRYKTVDTAEAPNIGVCNSEKNLTNILDFFVRDEYNTPLDLVMDTPYVRPPNLPPDTNRRLIGENELGMSLWLQLFF
jgi:hypothetical protein